MTTILAAFRRHGIQRFEDVRKFCEAPPYCLRVTEKGSLYALRYNRGLSDFHSQVVREARGIVFEKESNRIVSWAFNKFYEYGEDGPSYRERPNLRKSVGDPCARYEQKYDGVLIKVVKQPSGQLLVSTNGRIDAIEAPIPDTGGSFLISVADGDLSEPYADLSTSAPANTGREACATVRMKNFYEAFAEAGGLKLPYEQGFCYAFELLHPEVQTVIPASSVRLIHLLTRHLEDDFSELPPEDRFQNVCGVNAAEVLEFQNFKSCRDAARLLPWDNEGFVVSERNGHRIKVKSEAYVALQKLLAKDSENQADDALIVALTLHDACAPLPVAVEPVIQASRRKLEAAMRTCAFRAGGSAEAALTCLGRSARGAQLALEGRLGGRIPKKTRAVIAGAIRDWAVEGNAGPCDTNRIITALRSSRLTASELRVALDSF